MSRVVLAMPPDPTWHFQGAWETVFGNAWRVVLASMLGFWSGEFTNAFTMARMKLLTRGRWLWTRTIGSTVAGEVVDTLIFYPVAFLGVWPVERIGRVMVMNYGLKVGWEVLMTPVTYKVVGFLKRAEHEDFYDVGTDFTPFSLDVDRSGPSSPPDESA